MRWNYCVILKKTRRNNPIRLSYPSLGIEIKFLLAAWDDPRNPMTSIIILDKGKENTCSVCLKVISSKESLLCENKCGIVKYCSKKCYDLHIICHKKYCSR